MPIDVEFKKKLSISGEHKGHPVWGEVKPPTKLGIHGKIVAVDWDLCTGDGECVNVCPVGVFEMVDTPGHPASDKKSDPVNEAQCIFCLACEAVCPAQCIKVFME